MKVTQVLESLESKNIIFHYCTSLTAIEHILFKKELRLSPRKHSNDPIEKTVFQISYGGEVTDKNFESRTKEKTEEIYQSLKKRNINVRQVCFCMNDTAVQKKSNPYPHEYFGFLKPRMWDQYGNNYEGVCLAFDKVEILKNRNIELKRKIGYVNFEEFGQDYLKIDQNEVDQYGVHVCREFLVNKLDKLFYRKHVDYKGENEYKVCSFTEKHYDYIDIERSIKAIICFPKLINDYCHMTLINYSKKLKVPLLYLSMDNDGLKMDVEQYCNQLLITGYRNKKNYH